jgi:hypothetical protein
MTHGDGDLLCRLSKAQECASKKISIAKAKFFISSPLAVITSLVWWYKNTRKAWLLSRSPLSWPGYSAEHRPDAGCRRPYSVRELTLVAQIELTEWTPDNHLLFQSPYGIAMAPLTCGTDNDF